MVSVQLHSSQPVRMLGTKIQRWMRMMKVREVKAERKKARTQMSGSSEVWLFQWIQLVFCHLQFLL